MGEKIPDTHGPRKVLLDDRKLFKKIIHRSSLTNAWSKVWANGGAAGGDRLSLQHYARDLYRRIGRLRDDLDEGIYKPGPVRRVGIPKSGGRGVRQLSIPCVHDRIVQTAAATLLSPLLDEEFEPHSYGYRKGKSVQQAVAQISLAQRNGYNWLVDADIEKYFDRIPHNELMERWAESFSEGPLSELVWTWITSAAPSGRGVAQGSPFSPLLANLYLDRLDEMFSKQGARIVRFADDFVVLCRSEKGAENALARVGNLLARHGLELNEDKTRVRDFDQGFKFLGHLFVKSLVMKTTPQRADEAMVNRWMRQIAKDDASAEAEATQQAMEDAAKEARGYSPGFRVLYVRKPFRRLDVRNQAFSVEEHHQRGDEEPEWQEILAIPHQDIDRIELGPQVQISDEAERHALATDTPIAFVNGHGETLGWLACDLAPRAKRHLAQAEICLDEARRVKLARLFVDARLRNQRAVLRRLLASRTVPPKPVADALVRLNKIIARPGKGPLFKASTIAELMGNEGLATASWWRAIGALLPVEMTFSNRTRPAEDCANICFNFLSWLLERDISVAVIRAGLHPGFGALHSPSDRRDACVYDLMEEFRAHLIGGLTVYCVSRKMITVKMFTTGSDKLRMNRAGGDGLIRAYENRANGRVKSPRTGKKISWRQLMVEQAFSLAAHYEGSKTYQPYIMDY